MRRLLAIVMLGCLSSGCVGLMALHPEATLYKAPFAREQIYQDSAGKVRSMKTVSREAFLREWGEPLYKDVTADTEIWTYHSKRDWCGLVLGVIVPIPLVLPVCRVEDRVVFKGDAALSIMVSRSTDSGIMCGLFVNGVHGGPDWCRK
jgi:hypothetical protein